MQFNQKFLNVFTSSLLEYVKHSTKKLQSIITKSLNYFQNVSQLLLVLAFNSITLILLKMFIFSDIIKKSEIANDGNGCETIRK